MARKKSVTMTRKRLVFALVLSLSLGLSSCGVTKATIQRPAEGTVTTVTITTNNPITTNTNPTLNTPNYDSK